MSTSNNYFDYHQSLLNVLYQHCLTQLPFCSDEASDVDCDFIDTLKCLTAATKIDDTYNQQGQHILTQIISQYPHITPAINRDLLWYFGGDCLHYMGDEEIDLYQQLDELLYDRGLDYTTAKAQVFKLH